MAVVAASDTETIRSHATFIWSVADLLRGDSKQSDYGKVILPLTVPPLDTSMANFCTPKPAIPAADPHLEFSRHT